MEEIIVRPGTGFGKLELGMERGALEAGLDCRNITVYEFQAISGEPLTQVRYPRLLVTYRAGRAVELALLNAGEPLRARLGGLDLFGTDAEALLPALEKYGGFLCDGLDRELARTYEFPSLRLGLWREWVYHPKLLDEPWFRRELACDPDYRRYARFEEVLVWAEDFARPPMERRPVHTAGGRSVPAVPPPIREEVERIAEKYGLRRG